MVIQWESGEGASLQEAPYPTQGHQKQIPIGDGPRPRPPKLVGAKLEDMERSRTHFQRTEKHPTVFQESEAASCLGPRPWGEAGAVQAEEAEERGS